MNQFSSARYKGALCGVFSAGVICSGLFVALPPAQATPPPVSCLSANGDSDDYNVEGVDNVGSGGQRGIRSNVLAEYSLDDCMHVASLSVFGSSGGFVEWGWVLGYDCNGNYRSTPRLFMVYGPPGGGFTCHVSTQSLTEGTAPQLTLSDSNQNSWWGGRLSGTEYLQFNTDFTSGTAITNGERDYGGDSAAADFRAIEELHSGGWSNFDDIRQFVDTDPTYYFCRKSSYRNTVEHYLTPC
jgi:hypothetical protein